MKRNRAPRADTLKCVVTADTIERVSNDQARWMVSRGARYIAKSAYKRQQKREHDEQVQG